MKTARKIISYTLWTIVLFYLGVAVLLHVPAVQQWTGGIVASALAGKLGTRVQIGRVDLGFLNRIIIDDVQIWDQHRQKMLSAGRLSAKVDLVPLFDGQVHISSAQAFGLAANLYQQNADTPPNFQFVLDSLASKSKSPKTPLDLQIQSLVIRNGAVSWNRHDIAPTARKFNPAHLNITGKHIVHKIYQRNTRNDKQCAGHERMPRRVGHHERRHGRCYAAGHGLQTEEPGYQCRDECGQSDVEVRVAAFRVEKQPEAETEYGGDGSVKESRPVAAELYAEAATGKASSDSHLPRGVVAFGLTNALQFLLVSLHRVVLLYSAQREIAYLRDGSHVDAVVLAAFEFSVRVRLVRKVHHQHIVIHIHVQVLFGQAEVCSGAFHCSYDAACVRGTFRQQTACAQQQVEFVVQRGCDTAVTAMLFVNLFHCSIIHFRLQK